MVALAIMGAAFGYMAAGGQMGPPPSNDPYGGDSGLALDMGDGGKRSNQSASGRLTDKRVHGSHYGAPIPVGFGTIRLAGQMIWATEIIEEETITTADGQTSGGGGGGGGKGKGGKGGGGGGGGGSNSGSSASDSNYYANFAVAFAAGPAANVMKIWADGNLIHDKTGETEITHKLDLEFRFYPGDEVQEPDPLIAGSVGDGQVPAHRGLVYIVFERLNLQRFGLRIPSITAEVAFGEVENLPIKTGELASNAPTDGISWTPSNTAYDPFAGKTYSEADPNALFVTDTATGNMETWVDDMSGQDVVMKVPHPTEPLVWDEIPMTTTRFEPEAVGLDGAVYGVTAYFTNKTQLGRMEPDGFGIKRVFGQGGGTFMTNSSTKMPPVYKVVPILVMGAAPREFLLNVCMSGNWNVLDARHMTYVTHGEFPGGSLFSRTNAVAGNITKTTSVVFARHTRISGTSGVGLYKFTLRNPTYTYPENPAVCDVEMHEVIILDRDQHLIDKIKPGGTATSLSTMIFDSTDGFIVILLTIDGDTWWVKWDDVEQQPVWAVMDGSPEPPDYQRAVRGEFLSSYRNAGGITKRSLATGEVTHTEDGAEAGAILTDYVIYEGESNVVYSVHPRPNKIYLQRGARAAGSVAGTVSYLLQSIGLDPADFDVTAITGDIPGFVLANPDLTAGEVLNTLGQVYGFDLVETDFKLVFKSVTDTTPVQTLYLQDSQSDFLFLNEGTGAALREKRADEATLPQSVAVVHYDADRDYNVGQQMAQRPLHPYEYTNSKSKQQILVPFAITAKVAHDAAWRLLRDAWVGRTEYTGEVHHGHVALDPLDVVQIVGDRFSAVARIVSVTLGADFAVALTMKAAIPASYQNNPVDGADADDFTVLPPLEFVPDLDADGGSGWTSADDRSGLANQSPTRLYVLDTPFIMDRHAANGLPILYYAARPINTLKPWDGAAVVSTQDLESWDQETVIYKKAGVGYAMDALPAPADPFLTDTENTLTVWMHTRVDFLTGITQEQLLAGYNLAALRHDDGSVELFQYRDVVENADGSFTLSHLLRGRRGTEGFCDGHETGDVFVMINADWIEGGTLALDDIHATRSFVGITRYTSPIGSVPVPKYITARSLMPYAPVHLAAAEIATGYTLSWERRTRLGGSLKDDTGTVPLSEATEEYEVEILDHTGAVATSKTGVVTPSVNVTLAEVPAEPFDNALGGVLTAITLTNPGAESGGSVVGWTDTARTFVQSSLFHTGAKSFAPQDNAGLAEAYQDVAVPVGWYTDVDANRAAVQVLWWQGDFGGGPVDDWAACGVEALDGASASLGGIMAPDEFRDGFQERSIGWRLPSGTRTLRVKMRGNDKSRLDDVALSIQTAPPSEPFMRFRVYQISATAGRGFPGEAVVIVE